MPLNIPALVHEFFAQSQIPLTLSDPNLPDDPLVLANDAFYRMTGFGPDEALGANCRFLQGKETARASLNTIRGNFAAKRDTKVLIRNYRKSGEAFDNFLYIFTLFDEHDAPIYRVGSQFEVPAFQRAKAFEAHTTALRNDIEELNKSGALSQNHFIDMGELVGTTVKDLLIGRLDNLRAA